VGSNPAGGTNQLIQVAQLNGNVNVGLVNSPYRFDSWCGYTLETVVRPHRGYSVLIDTFAHIVQLDRTQVYET
jgi:hypothetical protein